MLPTRARNIHVAVDEDVRGCFWSHLWLLRPTVKVLMPRLLVVARQPNMATIETFTPGCMSSMTRGNGRVTMPSQRGQVRVAQYVIANALIRVVEIAGGSSALGLPSIRQATVRPLTRAREGCPGVYWSAARGSSRNSGPLAGDEAVFVSGYSQGVALNPGSSARKSPAAGHTAHAVRLEVMGRDILDGIEIRRGSVIPE